MLSIPHPLPWFKVNKYRMNLPGVWVYFPIPPNMPTATFTSSQPNSEGHSTHWTKRPSSVRDLAELLCSRK